LRENHTDLDAAANPMDDPTAYFSAMLEALDSEVERLLAGLTPEVRENTFVIFMGDNGTESDWVGQPFRSGRAKGSVYQGGVNVPLIISGPGVVKGQLSEALVNSTDLFSTIVEMTGMSIDDVVPAGVRIDSVSILPYLSDPGRDSIRQWVFAETFERNFDGIEDGDYAMRNHRYKLLRHRGNVQFYDLQNDPYEYIDLLARGLNDEERVHYDTLNRQVAELQASE
jgi:arylsulfatase B